MKKGLEWLLLPNAEQVFFSEYFDQKPMHIVRSEPGLLQPGDAERLLSEFQNSPFLDVKVLHPREEVTEKHYLTTSSVENVNVRSGIKLAAVQQLFNRHQATIVIDKVVRFLPSLEELVGQLEFELNSKVAARLRISPASPSFPAAYESHDEFILQVEGSQRVTIYSPVVRKPLAGQAKADINTEELDLVFDKEVHAGDHLYIPRGFVVQSHIGEEPSVEAILSVYNPTWAKAVVDGIGWLSRHDNQLRRGFNATFMDGVDTHAAVFEQVKKQLLQSLSAINAAKPASEPKKANVISVADEVMKNA